LSPLRQLDQRIGLTPVLADARVDSTKRLSLGGIVKRDARGVYDGPFSWEHAFGFRLVGMIVSVR
jgi:hypothetical protein